jgi:hypothetical protein
MTDHNMDHMLHIGAIAASDLATLHEKEATYQGSWKRRGGVGAFMMLARKWDRLESMLNGNRDPIEGPHVVSIYDLFGQIEYDVKFLGLQGSDGSALAEVRDLRRYLLLIEAEMVARGVVVLDKDALLGLLTRGSAAEAEDLTNRQLANVLHGRHADDNGEFTASSMGEANDAIKFEPDFERLRELDKKINEAPGWGASVGAMDEERKEILCKLASVFSEAEIARQRLPLSTDVPGTPEDGGQHARQPTPIDPSGDGSFRGPDGAGGEDTARRVPRPVPPPRPPYFRVEVRDGLTAKQLTEAAWPVFSVTDPVTSAVYLVADRRAPGGMPLRPAYLWRELNHKEWELTDAWARGMYAWDEGQSKYLLRAEYHARWARRP